MFIPPVDEIDFLPAGFHVRRIGRRARTWRWGVTAMFFGLIGFGLLGNRLQLNRLEAERNRLRPQAEAVAGLDLELARLRRQIDTLGDEATLRARLRLRPATTRLLAGVTAPLPPSASLTELTVAEERGTAAPPSDKPKSNEARVSAELKDLRRIIDAEQARRTVLLRGVASEDAVVSDYLSALAASGLFDEVRLLFTDRHEHRGIPLRSFSVQVRLRHAKMPPPMPEVPAAASESEERA